MRPQTGACILNIRSSHRTAHGRFIEKFARCARPRRRRSAQANILIQISENPYIYPYDTYGFTGRDSCHALNSEKVRRSRVDSLTSRRCVCSRRAHHVSLATHAARLSEGQAMWLVTMQLYNAADTECRSSLFDRMRATSDAICQVFTESLPLAPSTAE